MVDGDPPKMGPRIRGTSQARGAQADGVRRSRFKEERIVGIPKEHEAGAATATLCHGHGIGRQAFYRW